MFLSRTLGKIGGGNVSQPSVSNYDSHNRNIKFLSSKMKSINNNNNQNKLFLPSIVNLPN